MKPIIALLAALFSATCAMAQMPPRLVNIVTAENFYGDIARQIGGDHVVVTSILSNPDQDPHLFEVSPATGRAVSAADIAVYSGIDYDPWMQDLLNAARSTHRVTIDVAELGGHQDGDNPHVWYDLKTIAAYAAALQTQLTAQDPGHATDYRQNLAAFQASLVPIQAKIAALRTRLAGTPVTATEPIFGYMFDALGMRSLNQSFQISVMNDTEPSAADIGAFEDDLKTHKVKLLIYNSQASDATAGRMREIANAAHVPVVGATETMPLGAKNYQDWISRELDAVDRALLAS